MTYGKFSRGSRMKCPNENESETHSVMSDSLQRLGLYSPWNSPGQNTGVGSLSLLQGIFPTQGLNPGLPHCRRILYQLSHKGSPRTQEWVDYPFSKASSRPRNRNGVSCIAGAFFTNWAIREAPQKGTLWLDGPGKEPGPLAWQARLLPLNHPCTNESDAFQMSVASLKGGLDPWGPGLKDPEPWSNSTVLVLGVGLSVMWQCCGPFLLSLLILGQQ